MGTNKKLKAYVRFDGSGRIVPSSVILQRNKPKVGNWKEIDANECCNNTVLNFDVTANWSGQGVTNKQSFILFMESKGLSNITVTNFNLNGNNLQCNLTANVVEQYALDKMGVTEIKKLGNILNIYEYLYIYLSDMSNYNPEVVPNAKRILIQNNSLKINFNPKLPLYSGTTTIHIINNSLEEFNPSLPLPNNLEFLELHNNPNLNTSTFCLLNTLPISLTNITLVNCTLSLADYTNLEIWANAQPSFTNTCTINFAGNTNSVSGTNLETILISKNCSVLV